MEVVFLSYSDAQKLIPFFKAAVKSAPYAEAKESAQRILQELELVRNLSYEPLSGRQCILSKEEDKEFLLDALATVVYSEEMGFKKHIKGAGK